MEEAQDLLVTDGEYSPGIGCTIRDILYNNGYNDEDLKNEGVNGLLARDKIFYTKTLEVDKLILIEFYISWLVLDNLDDNRILINIKDHIRSNFPKAILYAITGGLEKKSRIFIPRNLMIYERVSEIALILFHTIIICDTTWGNTQVFKYNIEIKSDEELTRNDIDRSWEIYYEQDIKLEGYNDNEQLSIWVSKYFSNRTFIMLEGLEKPLYKLFKKPVTSRIIKNLNNEFELIIDKK